VELAHEESSVPSDARKRNDTIVSNVREDVKAVDPKCRQFLVTLGMSWAVDRCLKGLCVVFVLATALLGQTSGTKDIPVTAVTGESWLNHLRRNFDETSMGKTGRLGPAPVLSEETPCPQLDVPALRDRVTCNIVGSQDEDSSPGFSARTVILHGSDLYRLNCRGCHGESGLGAPPDINSVINPVRATSVAAIMERMKNIGMDMSRADAAVLAKQSKAALLQRLHNGGQNMPPFSHLNEAEIRSLFAYLTQLAGVSGAEREQVVVRESPARVGELIVKSTCHICHNTAGLNPTPQELIEGAIPPLNTLPFRTNASEFVRKVTNGAPVMMGAPPVFYRGRMPVFYYLSQSEAADAYRYLSSYVPYQWAQAAASIASAQQASGPPSIPYNPASEVLQVRNDISVNLATLRLAGIIAVVLLTIGGVGFAVFEFRRLPVASEAHSVAMEREAPKVKAESEELRVTTGSEAPRLTMESEGSGLALESEAPGMTTEGEAA
jgi:mono/diheme cytochrome c family protein